MINEQAVRKHNDYDFVEVKRLKERKMDSFVSFCAYQNSEVCLRARKSEDYSDGNDIKNVG